MQDDQIQTALRANRVCLIHFYLELYLELLLHSLAFNLPLLGNISTPSPIQSQVAGIWVVRGVNDNGINESVNAVYPIPLLYE